MAATEVASVRTQAPHHFYREHQGLDSISRTFQSSELFTPFLVSQRPTVSGIRKECVDGYCPVCHGEGLQPQGLPINQYYDRTKLKKSNVRSNDELVPRPTQVDMSKLQINREFPAEHPYSSHMSRFAVFPSFTNSGGDYQTGAIVQHPLHPQMPANPYPITVVRQSKGGSDRWERQELPLDTEKKPLKWPGDRFYQQRKTPTSGQQQFYPIPPKAVLPNQTSRSLDGTVDPRTANALQNIERAQWQTTYNKNFTGNGPANSLRLDNFDEKLENEQRRGIEDHGLQRNTLPYLRPGTVTQRTAWNKTFLNKSY